jgi:hypothetical protein
MPEPHHDVTPEIQSRICALIRRGAFPEVAAEATGIPQATFRAWLAQGEQGDGGESLRAFAAEVREAAAQARVLAEIEVLKKHPEAWLKHGPGKETADTPGWTVTVRPQITNDNRTLNILLQPEMMGLFGALLQVLAPYPEARAAVAQALAGLPAPVERPS